jgi:hypothetical protein
MGCFLAAGRGAERHVNRAWVILTAAGLTAHRPDAGRPAGGPVRAPSAALAQPLAAGPRWEPSAPVPAAASRLGPLGPGPLGPSRWRLGPAQPGGPPQSGRRPRPPPGQWPAG